MLVGDCYLSNHHNTVVYISEICYNCSCYWQLNCIFEKNKVVSNVEKTAFFTLKAQPLFLPIVGVPFVLSKGESSKSHNSDLVIFLVRKKIQEKKYFSCRYLKLSVWVCCAGAGCLQLLILTETFKRTFAVFFSSRQ